MEGTTFKFLTIDELRERVPSAFTRVRAPHIGSNRYQLVDTIRMLGFLEQKGWRPYRAYQTRSKAEKNVGFERHFIRLRNPELFIGTRENIEAIPEILLVNSYGCRCSFKLYAALTRLQTGSEFVFDGEAMPKVVAAHSDHYEEHDKNGKGMGDPKILKILSGEKIKEMAGQMTKVVEVVTRMKSTNTTRADQKELAHDAIAARWDYQWPKTGWEELVKPTADDEGNDLWSIFNRVHQKTVKGGWSGNGGKAIKPLIEPNRELKTNGRLFQVAHDILERLEGMK